MNWLLGVDCWQKLTKSHDVRGAVVEVLVELLVLISVFWGAEKSGAPWENTRVPGEAGLEVLPNPVIGVK